MHNFCDCEEYNNLKKNHDNLFRWLNGYGWMVVWTELTNEKSYTQKHTYGIGIRYCPMCGKELRKVEN